MAQAGHDLDAVLARAAAWLAEDRGVAIATVVRTWGSSPRPAGSKLALTADGAFVGSVSGGCIEAAVIAEGIALLAGERGPGVLAFGVSDAAAWEVGLACGGRVEVFVERADAARIGALRAARAANQTAVALTALDGSWARLVEPAAPAEASIATAIAEAVRADAARVAETAAGDVLVEPHLPPLRLIVVGAVHVTAPLAQMAALAGFAVTVVDPRRAWATAARFPELELIAEWPDVALERLAPDARTAVVALTHDPKLDDPALLVALRSPAFYLGCLGSAKTHAARRERLAAAGIAAAALDRLHGPVGLAIGARTPAEIAVAILAEIIATRRAA